MKICNINTVDEQGGAAKAAYSLHTNLNKIENVCSTYLVKNKRSSDNTVKEYSKRKGYLSFFKKKILHKILKKEFDWNSKNKREDLEIFTDVRTPFRDIFKQIPPGTDIINLHWIARFIDYQSFFNACTVPMVWTLHDMNAFTGGCHYNINCEKYKHKCGACPQLGSKNQKDLSNKIWTIKRKIYSNLEGRLHIVTPSKWLKEEAEKSTLLEGFPVYHIPNGINTHLYKPIAKKIAKEGLDIDSDAKTILFLADSTQNKRKGFKYLSMALKDITNKKDIVLLSVGRHKPDTESDIKHIHLGYVSNEYFLRLIYSAAELFVISSVQDNLPNTVLEAMACGTPVVGFDIGGIPDMIKSGYNGKLVGKIKSQQLGSAINDLLVHNYKRKQMGNKARETVIKKFSHTKQAKDYQELYRQILGM